MTTTIRENIDLRKYNEFIPLKLLKKQFIEDYIDFEGLKRGI